ncbi:MAG: glycosyltransferase family 2 protein [Rhodocyclaceae bacterium]|jgi:glycosyltransferase involved in cell wall biosynthesis|nr:glycosyltransferase family 2 protein [Rhodocyclaceae bacterium]MCA3023682.1 glycosyltransferase family 2 protein [Rhodocyclaceae bacterium]MCA3030337.1 glycosyltransferase family 2 protein [Rhodocyclaceae bacterium]MCA3035669.1 glycosyltransferase family 2 protein [Rhodocyclaceae bacterium]MCA3045573.1 glycosyltransferase family 2 protein [Rhodocyclaceae bacterium]
MTTENLELTILMPCLNEAETVVTCIEKARTFLSRAGIGGEVLIADNGSTDGSQQLATDAGARVAAIPERGYGAALLGGITAARGRYIIMGDADDSYDFSSLDAFVAKLREGHPLVMGNRFAGGIMPGAMPPLHRYLGNPVLSFIGRLLFRSPIGDFHCGLRGFDRAAILKLGLASPGMEFASEMIVKATLAGYNIAEVPTILHPDGRSRPPHLRSWRDGWRHLRFLLMMSPRWLLLYPGCVLLGLGLLGGLRLSIGPLRIGGVGFDIHTLLYAAGASILGLQLVLFSLLARAIGCVKGVLPITQSFRRFMRIFTLEKGIAVGLAIVGLGIAAAVYSVQIWVSAHLSAIDPQSMMRIAIPSVALMVAGAEILFASFILSFIDVRAEQLPAGDRR